MLDLTLISATADPAALYDTYRNLSQRYEQADAQLDEIQLEFDTLGEDQWVEREQLVAELDRLGNDHTVLLGWMAAFYAAYTFALRGTRSAWVDSGAGTSVCFVDSPGGQVRALAAVTSMSLKEVQR